VEKICRNSLLLIKKINPNDCCNIRDKPLSQEECDFIGMPKGFDGSIYTLRKHVYQYTPRESQLLLKYRTYVSINNLQPGLATVANSLSYLLLHYFHWE